MAGGVSRRGFLTGAIAAAASPVLALEPARPMTAGRSLRVAYITDVHLDTTSWAARGFTRCLKQIQNMDDQPDLIIQGGDIIMDGLTRSDKSVEAQYSWAKTLLHRHSNLPIEHVIGNHDVWGWGRADKSLIENDSRYGKRWWLNWTGCTSTYRSFNRNGWHFVLLDSIMPDHLSYMARLDSEQARWLQEDLRNTPSTTPVCIVSHVPIVSAGAMFFDKCEKPGHWHVPHSLMHIDARWMKDLLVIHPNVKACLSGHIHMRDQIEYNGVKHFGVGAVCGAWWRGKMQETPPQYGIVDFYEDGNVHTTFVNC